MYDKIHEMCWQNVRFIMLSVDRELFGGPHEAYEAIKSTKAIARMVQNLQRVQGIVIKNWLWFIEWHSDGFPHYHMFIETEIPGRAGMIGGDNLRKYWKLGRVYESYVKGPGHWDHLTGYFKKRGYFQKKEQGEKFSQNALPEWAREYTKTIRRFGSMAKKRAGMDMRGKVEIKYTESVRKNSESEPCESRRPYDLILKSCGSEVLIAVACEAVELPMIRIKVAYRKFINDNPCFKYVTGVGYHVQFTWSQLETFLIGYRNDIVSLIVDEELESPFAEDSD